MTPGLVRELHAAGITLMLRDGALRYDGPKGALTPILRDAVREVREELILWLRAEAVLCYACCRRTEEGQPAGQGVTLIYGRLYHLRCLPAGWAYDAATGQVAHVEETLFALPAAPNAAAAMAR